MDAMNCVFLFLRCALAVVTLAGAAFASDNETATNRFGFTGPEIFPIDSAIGLLQAADLDGDGLKDLVIVNNSRSKINLLYNQTGKTNLAEKPQLLTRREPNELPLWHFRLA